MSLSNYDSERPILAIDSETDLFAQGDMAPDPVCYSFAWRDERGRVKTDLLGTDEGGLDEFEDSLEQAIAGNITIGFQNGPYDVACAARRRPKILELAFDAYEAGAIHDTMHGEQLNDTAQGMLRVEWDEEKNEFTSKKSYALENLTRIHLGWPFYKDEWRLRYGELKGMSARDYPEAARIYPQKDAEGTLLCAERQREIAAAIAPHNPLEAALAHVCRSYLALHLVATWGEEIDSERAQALHACLSEYAGGFVPDLEKYGIIHRQLRGKNVGKLTKKKKPITQLVAAALIESGRTEGLDNAMSFDDAVAELIAEPAAFLEEHYLTDGGKSGKRQVRCAADVLKTLARHTGYRDPNLAARITRLADYLEAEKLKSSFSGPLVLFGNGPLHARYGFAETLRTTCSGGPKKRRTGLNIQQLPRKMPKALLALMLARIGEEIDVRSCFVPREGYVQSSTDYSSLEMVTFAQSCIDILGWSSLADALNNDIDPHSLFAAGLLGTSYEDVIAGVAADDPTCTEARQRAKVGNFGFPGGMGAPKFQVYARGQNLFLTLDQCKELRDGYREQWQEAKQFFRYASDALEAGGGEVAYIGERSRFISGGCGYTDFCNRHFQEPAAFGATGALWRYVRECYDARLQSPLYGSRVVAFIHDEIRAEHPDDVPGRASAAADRGRELMIEEMQPVVPNVKAKASTALTRRWYKGAKEVRDKNGFLVPWEPKKKKEAA